MDAGRPPPASAPSVNEPQTAQDAVKTGESAVKAAKGGEWWYFSALVIMLIMFGIKRIGLLETIGRWRYFVVPALSISAALLAAFQGGVSWEAAGTILLSGMATAKLQELWEHGIRGKPHKSSA